MGNDPKKFVTNRFAQTHDVSNLYVCDASTFVFPTDKTTHDADPGFHAADVRVHDREVSKRRSSKGKRLMTVALPGIRVEASCRFCQNG